MLTFICGTFYRQNRLDYLGVSTSFPLDILLKINNSVSYAVLSISVTRKRSSKYFGTSLNFSWNFFSNSSRNPRFNGSRYHKQPKLELVDFRNNVIYNWGFNSSYGGESGQQNVVNNYYKSGPATRHRNRIAEPWDAKGKWYVDGNFVYGFPKITLDNWAGGIQGEFKDLVRVDYTNPFEINLTHSAIQAYELVLADGGASLPKRDTLDNRVVREVLAGIATYGGEWGAHSGIIDSQEQIGGWPPLTSTEPPDDKDSDGMPNAWEIKHGLNPLDPEDRNDDFNGDGYTNLEKYLNSLTIRKDFLNAPGELAATLLLSDKISLQWKENTLEEDGFMVERRIAGKSDFLIIGETGPNITTFLDHNLSPRTIYEYQVRAFRGKITSIVSNAVRISTNKSDIRSQ
jgi:hypothetical protein